MDSDSGQYITWTILSLVQSRHHLKAGNIGSGYHHLNLQRRNIFSSLTLFSCISYISIHLPAIASSVYKYGTNTPFLCNQPQAVWFPSGGIELHRPVMDNTPDSGTIRYATISSSRTLYRLWNIHVLVFS